MSFPWDRWHDRLRELETTGLSAAKMAETIERESGMEVSKNMVISQMRRLKIWPSKASERRQFPGRHETPEAKAARAAAKGPRFRAKRADTGERAPSLPAEPLPAQRGHVQGARPCSILKVSDKRCRWPVAEWAPHQCNPLAPIFCGGDTPPEGGPYCRAHAALSVAPKQDRKQEQREAA